MKKDEGREGKIKKSTGTRRQEDESEKLKIKGGGGKIIKGASPCALLASSYSSRVAAVFGLFLRFCSSGCVMLHCAPGAMEDGR